MPSLASAKGCVDGKAGYIKLIEEVELEILVIEWAEESVDEPATSTQFMIAAADSVRCTGNQCILCDESGEEVFRCDVREADADAWRSALAKALTNRFGPSAESLRQMMLNGLQQIAAQRAPRRELNSYLNADNLAVLLADPECVIKLAAHLPAALQGGDVRTNLRKVFRSTDFRQAGVELTEALHTTEPETIFRQLEVPLPDNLSTDPVQALVNALSK